jgi:alanyl-tRNA synthetase
MTAQEIRKKYLEFFAGKGHKVLPRALLVPQDDPTTLFTGSGMQALIPYLLGEEHPEGKRLTDSQTCFRADDMDEVGDNRHTTFFEMLGNWSLGDYFKAEQLPWFWEFLTKVVDLDPKKLYVTCFIGDEKAGVPKDTESAEIWKKLFADSGIKAKDVDFNPEQEMTEGARIFYYDASKNWWSREGGPNNMAEGEPGGPSSEVFYDFGEELKIHEGSQFKDKKCHPNCDCGRFIEIGNSVFMSYKRTKNGIEPLAKPNVDFGGGMERITAAVINNPDMFQINTIKPILDHLEKISGKDYKQFKKSMQIIADHMRAATFLAIDGVMPSNKQQGYVLRRLLRRAIRYSFEIGIEQDLFEQIIPTVIEIFREDYPEAAQRQKEVTQALIAEEKLFRQTLRRGLKEFEKIVLKPTPIHRLINAELMEMPGAILTGEVAFTLLDTYGFPVELSVEEARRLKMKIDDNLKQDFNKLMDEQRKRSRTAGKGVFKGGLADSSEQVVKYHTATHLMYQALKQVLGDHVVQRGSNITAERIRFDFSNPEKVTPEQQQQIEDIVNQAIAEDLPVTWKEESTAEALKTASGAFGDKYGDKVKVYTIGDPAKPFSREVCGGPHVEHTGQIGEGNKKFKIIKEEASSAGVRRIKAVLQ